MPTEIALILHFNHSQGKSHQRCLFSAPPMQSQVPSLYMSAKVGLYLCLYLYLYLYIFVSQGGFHKSDEDSEIVVI